MEIIIYADILILLNAVITYILLLTTTEFIGVSGERMRYIAGSFAGGFFSMIIMAPEMNLLLTFTVKSIICVLIVIITYGLYNIKIFLKCFCGFLAVSFLYAGIIYLLSDKLLSERIYYNNGYAYYRINSITLIIFCIIVFLSVRILSKTLFRHDEAELIYDMKIIKGEKSQNLKAFFDTGNSVSDIYTGKPVIIVNINDIKDFFSEDGFYKLESFFEGDTESLPEKVRLIPVKGIGKISVLPAFSADKAIIKGESSVRVVSCPTVVIASDIFYGKSFNALINVDVLGRV